VFPALVAPGADGTPYSVRYHVLPSLLLNEMQKQHRAIEEQRTEHRLETERHEAQLSTLLARVSVLESLLATESTESAGRERCR